MFEVSTTSFQRNVDKRRLVAERTKFAKHVMLFAGVCFGGKGRLHFIPDTAKVNAKLYVETLLPELVQDCRSVLLSGFVYQQDGAPAHMAKLAQDWIATNCSEFIGKDEWPPNSPNLNSLDYHVWGAMLERYKSFQPSQRTSMSSRKFCSCICHRTRSTRRLKFGLVRKLVVDTSNIR